MDCGDTGVERLRIEVIRSLADLTGGQASEDYGSGRKNPNISCGKVKAS